MAGGFDNLSLDDFKRLSDTINEAKELIKLQERLLKQSLAMEEQIIRQRTAGLKEYNDVYSKLLNGVAEAQEGLSREMFKVTEAGKAAADNVEKAAKNTAHNTAGSNKAYTTVTKEQQKELGTAETASASRIVERFNLIAKKQKDIHDKSKAASDAETNAAILQLDLEEARSATRADAVKKYADKEIQLQKTLTDLTVSRLQSEEDQRSKMRTTQISHIQEMATAELRAQELVNEIRAEQDYYSTEEAALVRARQINAINEAAALNAFKKQMDEERREAEFRAMEANAGVLHEADVARINEWLALRYEGEEALQEFKAKYLKKQIEDEQKRREKEEKQERDREKERHKAQKSQSSAVIAGAVSLNGFNKENNVDKRIESLKELRKEAVDDGADKNTVNLAIAIKSLSSLAQQLENKMEEIASNKSAVDTRLQGSSSETWAGSYWDQIVHDMTSISSINPYFKQEDFANKIKEFVDIGIAFDLEQRAFLATISNKIATTFEAADGTLLRLIRIQQADSTAGRLGMEAALNSFLNNMYENTEYLKQVASSVRSSLAEMEALMEGAEAAEVEYQVQKWLGSLYSVGMSQDAVSKISNTLGQIAAGQIEGLNGDGAGNLLIMAANEAGLSIADILTEGLDASNTNKLMQAVVNYLADIAESTKDNRVVQQQLANVFGVRASDLKAATNLASKDSVSAISSNSMTYDSMLGYLTAMAGSMGQRTSMGEMMTNIWNNVNYSLAGSMASNPISYFMYKIASLLDSTTGGIAIPAISVVGNMVDLETTVADLIRVASVGTGVLGSLGSLVSGLTNSFSGVAMLEQLGIKTGAEIAITPRGGGFSGNIGAAGGTVSESGYWAGNASSNDIKNSTMQEANDTKKQLMVEAQEEAEANEVTVLNETVLKIYELLDDVAHGNGCFKVKVEGYGLTKAGTSSGSIGGVNALNNLSSNPNSSISGTSLSGSGSSANLASGGVNSAGISGSIDFGGWTTAF